eukprot:scaffold433_cov260-Chaetoceros_neogracile.AAC.52
MDKENVLAVRRSSSAAAGRTPPRLLCPNTFGNTSNNHSNSNPGKEESSMNHSEEYSFHKMRGALQQFENKQKAHLTKNAHVKVALKPIIPTETEATPHAAASTTTTFINDPINTSLQSHSNNNKILMMKSPLMEKEQKVPPSIPKDEDFSFQALKQRALELKGKSPLAPAWTHTQTQAHQNQLKHTGSEETEDFSFKKLKERALNTEHHGSKTPQRNRISNSHHSTTAPNTPVRTPAKRSIPMTPQSHSKSRCYAAMSPRIPMPTSQFSRTGTPQKAAAKRQEVPTPNRTGTATTFNPHRFKFGPNVKKEEVEATDNSIASVHKISQWLSDDPFQKKKQVVIRRGTQIAQKSRAFEQDEVLKHMLGRNRKETRVEREKEHFSEGKVSQGKSWLKSAFGEGKEEVEEEFAGVLGKQKMISNAFKKSSRSSSGSQHF